MAIFQNRRTTELEEEIDALNGEIVTLKVKLKISEDKRTELNAQSDKDFETISLYINRTHALNREIDEMKARLNNSAIPHNARGAGRKSKITADTISQAKALKSEGKSLNEIAKILTEQMGIGFSKSTVKKMMDMK